MITSIKEILAPLDPYWDRIVRRPMSEAELDDLERKVGLSVPAPLHEYLSEVGLFQDLTHWQASSIKVFDTPAVFVRERQFLSETLMPSRPELFPFGHDGYGNVFALPAAPETPWRIRFVNHETGKVSRREDFADWLQGVVARVLKTMRKRPTNERKTWCVQFSFSKTSFVDLMDLLSAVGDVKKIDPDWMNPDTSPAGVTSTERRIELNGEVLKVGRLEYGGWEMPMISLDMHEPVTKGIEHSQIRMLNDLFTERCSDYKLVDYGPLDLSETVTG